MPLALPSSPLWASSWSFSPTPPSSLCHRAVFCLRVSTRLRTPESTSHTSQAAAPTPSMLLTQSYSTHAAKNCDFSGRHWGTLGRPTRNLILDLFLQVTVPSVVPDFSFLKFVPSCCHCVPAIPSLMRVLLVSSWLASLLEHCRPFQGRHKAFPGRKKNHGKRKRG